MNIEISFTGSEVMRLLNHADTVLHAGHWGSSDIVIPEQQTLLANIKESNGRLDLNFFYTKMLVDWLYEGTYEGTTFLPEDISIIGKLCTSTDRFIAGLKSDSYEIKSAERLLLFLKSLLEKAG